MRNTHLEQMFSALHPKADSSQTSRHVRKVPILLQTSVRIFGETLKREAIEGVRFRLLGQAVGEILKRQHGDRRFVGQWTRLGGLE